VKSEEMLWAILAKLPFCFVDLGGTRGGVRVSFCAIILSKATSMISAD
jgi:hypothetical protein